MIHNKRKLLLTAEARRVLIYFPDPIPKSSKAKSNCRIICLKKKGRHNNKLCL